MSEPVSRLTGRLVVGLFVITLGVLFTLDSFGVLEAGEIVRWWPALLVAYGLARLTGFYARRQPVTGVLLTLAGAWMLLHEVDLVRTSVWNLWPLVLILIGASMVGRALGPQRAAASGGDPSSRLNAFALWAGLDHKMTTEDFRGGDVAAIMGGHDIDLRAAKMPDGTAIIDLVVIWGGVDVRVPEDWKVTSQLVVIMGGFEDHTRPPAAEPSGRLILRGFVLMGGVEVKN